MPFQGNNFIDRHAGIKSDSLWNDIDKYKNINEIKNVKSNTWTAQINSYVDFIINSNNLTLLNNTKVDSKYNLNVYSNNDMILNYIVIDGQNHCWSGHKHSGPNSSNTNNLHLDATYLITKFFNIGNNYKPTINIIPENFKYIK